MGKGGRYDDDDCFSCCCLGITAISFLLAGAFVGVVVSGVMFGVTNGTNQWYKPAVCTVTNQTVEPISKGARSCSSTCFDYAPAWMVNGYVTDGSWPGFENVTLIAYNTTFSTYDPAYEKSFDYPLGFTAPCYAMLFTEGSIQLSLQNNTAVWELEPTTPALGALIAMLILGVILIIAAILLCCCCR